MTHPADGRGVLAMWNDCRPGDEADFEDWYATEHIHERLAVPGFLTGRRYHSLSGAPGYLTVYETVSPATLVSAPYLARLDDPTPWTRRVMSGMLTNMSRTLCRQARVIGSARGGWAITARWTAQPSTPVESTLDGLMRATRAVRVALWLRADVARPDQTEEQRLRGGDGEIAAAVLAEAGAPHVAADIAAWLARHGPEDASIGVYRLASALDRRDLAP